VIERLEMRMLASKVQNTECDNDSCLMYSHEARKPSCFCFIISVETHNVCNILSFLPSHVAHVRAFLSIAAFQPIRLLPVFKNGNFASLFT